jgi:methylthioribose-1-phosphate isomerase
MRLDDLKENCLLIWGAISDHGLEQLKEEGRLVVVPENRPYMTGLIHNAPLLGRHGVDFVYCTDNMLGLLFYKNKIIETFLFYRKIEENGVTGVSGSLYAALLSRLHGVPVRTMPQADLDLAGPDSDASSLCGKKFVMDQNQIDSVVSPDDELVERALLE